MAPRTQDIVVGTILLALSVAWSTAVWLTIPAGQGGGDVGPRAFPLWLGVFLGVMALLMILRSLPPKIAVASTQAQGKILLRTTAGRERRQELWFIGLTFALLTFYGMALPVIGFNLATAIVVLIALWLCVRERSVKILTGMTIGIPLMCWLIFGKLLHIPLATGGWINLG